MKHSLLALLLLCGAPAWALECPAGPLVGVQVLSAKQGEVIDESAPPDLIPDEQSTRAGILHQVWKMNSDGPGWDFFVWCTYQGNPKVVKLPAPNVKRCERTLSAAHPDKPPQHMTCE